MNYQLYHKNVYVAEIDFDPEMNKIKNVIEVSDYEHLPVGVTNINGFSLSAAIQFWWQNRLIPKNRTKVILENPEFKDLFKGAYGFNLTDHYWIKSDNDAMTWEKGNFFTNAFNENLGKFIISGKSPSVLNMSSNSPDLFSNGEQDKRWMILDGIRTLVKYGRPPYFEQPFNEVLASEICKRLDIPHVKYKIAVKNDTENIKILSLCPCFSDENIEFIPAGFVQYAVSKEKGESAYAHFLRCCKALGMSEIISIEKSLGCMMALDYIIANQDRHFGNFGFLRDSASLNWKGFVPNFDCGNSMFFEYPTSDLRKSGSLMENAPCKTFASTQKEQLKKFSSVIALKNLDLKKLDGIEQFYKKILSLNPKVDDERRNILSGYLKQRVITISNILFREHSTQREYTSNCRR